MPRKKKATTAPATAATSNGDSPPSPAKTKQCPKCKFWNANRAVKCQSCGEPLALKHAPKAKRKAKASSNGKRVAPAGQRVDNIGSVVEFIEVAKAIGLENARIVLDTLSK